MASVDLLVHREEFQHPIFMGMADHFVPDTTPLLLADTIGRTAIVEAPKEPMRKLAVMTYTFRPPRVVDVYKPPAGAAKSQVSEKTPLLTDKVGRKAIVEAPKEATTKTAEIAYFGGDLFAVPRMVDGLGRAIAGTPNPAGMHGLGLTSVFSVYTGAVTGKRGYSEYSAASKIEDTTGQVTGAINMTRAPLEIMGGVTFTAFRGLSIAATFTTSKAVLAAQAVFGVIGSGFYAATYALLAIPSCISFYKNWSFSAKLEGAMNKAKTPLEKAKVGIKTVVEELTGTKEELKAFLEKVAQDPKIWHGKELLDPKPIEESLFTNEERLMLYKEAKRLAPDRFSVDLLYGHFKERFVTFKKKKEAQFARKTGPESLSLVKKELKKPLKDQLSCKLEMGEGLKEAEEILGTIKTESRKNRLLHVGIIIACVVGMAALIAGTVFSGGAIGIAIAVAWVVSSVLMLAIDGYFLYKAMQQGEMDKKDKIAFFAINVLMIMVAGAGVFFSGGLAPIIIGGAMLCLWVGVAGYSYYQWKKPKDEELPEAPYRGAAYIAPKKRKYKTS